MIRRLISSGSRSYAVIATLIIISTPVNAQGFEWPERAKNLKVLPEDMPPQRLRAVMTGFSRALGVRCSHCHVGEEGQPLSKFDFASDENPKKDVARAMLEMLGDINRRLDTVQRSGSEPVNMWCHTCHRGVPRPQTLDEALLESYASQGADAVIEEYEKLRSRFYGRGAYDFGERSLNTLGYALLERDDAEAAIAVFRMNAAHFPESSNVYDSLAEAFLTSGRADSAKYYYERAVELDPRNRNARQKLKELEGK